MPARDSDCVPNVVGRFATTHWSAVWQSRDKSLPGSDAALAELCEAYWRPLYIYIRRTGCSVHDAEDLTQEFFSRFLARDYLKTVDRQKGKFRSFLLASLKHFLLNEYHKANAQKRGGGKTVISIDSHETETRYAIDPAVQATPEELFDREWARTALETVLIRLRREYTSGGKKRFFEEAKACLAGEAINCADLGSKLGVSEGAAKVAVHRLRKRYRELMRQEIARTVDAPEEVEQELRYLFKALG